MAGNNQFYPVATGDGANVLTAASWSASAVRQSGFQSGIAPSNAFNTAWRQSSSIASIIGAFIAANGLDALDNGDLATLLSNFRTALSAEVGGFIPSTALVHAGTDTSSTVNQIIINTVTPAVAALVDFQVYEIRPANDVTGATTVRIGTLPAVPLVRQDGIQFTVGDAPRNQSFLAVYIGGIMYRLGFSASEVSRQATTVINALKIAGGTPQQWSSPGTYTLSLPANVTFAITECRGGGGGGGGANSVSAAGSGGGGGGSSTKVATTVVATVLQIIVGVGGTGGFGGASVSNGTAGGTTVVSVVSGAAVDYAGVVYNPGATLCAATGGGLGYGSNNGPQQSSAGVPGMGVGGDANISGDPGGYPYLAGPFIGGVGGGSPGSGGQPQVNYGNPGNSTTAAGVGGNGSSSNGAGGNGAPGRVTIQHP